MNMMWQRNVKDSPSCAPAHSGVESSSRFVGTPLTIAAGLMAVVSTAFLTRDFATLASVAIENEDLVTSLQLLILYVPVYVLLYGAFSYIANRYGHFKRNTGRSDDTNLDLLFDADVSDLLVLVPSYKEQPSVIRQTLLSAALVEYSAKQVVLLIDNPPIPRDIADQRLISETIQVVCDLQVLFERPAERFAAELDQFLVRSREQVMDIDSERDRISKLYLEVANWFETQAKRMGGRGGEPANAHVDQFFIEKVLLLPATVNRSRAYNIQMTSRTENELLREYRHLAGLFRTTFTTFERKRYVNCSQAPNKATNLNTYISLIGKSFKEGATADGRHLTVCRDDEQGAIRVPSCEFLLTLDADSIVLWDYALRLTEIMRAEANETLAVVQTPYSAYPGAGGLLERIAGATTDIQYLSHQGMTFFDATSWVGANALLRLSALEDIATEFTERGHACKTYIQDETLIEDTAATVDLIAKGWRLSNYQSRLAYSATPSDFGSLLIQRRRWSNGGLLIFPALIRCCFSKRLSFARAQEFLIRAHYLLSPAIMSTAMLMLTFASFDDALFTIWVPLAAVPYQLLYACDLNTTGRSWKDLPRVYALNMSLMVVQLGGTLQSVRQAISKRKSPFSRTPKVASRTTTPVIYLAAIVVLMIWCISLWIADLMAGRVYHLLFTSLNTAAFVYVFFVYIGVRAAIEDVRAHFTDYSPLPPPILALPPPNTAERMVLSSARHDRAGAQLENAS